MSSGRPAGRHLHTGAPELSRPDTPEVIHGGRQEDWEEPEGRAAAVRRAVPDFGS